MADELVAELTLRLRDEMLGGIQQIRDEFAQLKDSLGLLNAPLSQTEQLMAELTAPNALVEGLNAATADADKLADSISGIGAAIDENSPTAAIQAGLKRAQADAKALVDTIGGVTPASEVAATSILGIGTAIDSDAAKMQALLVDMVQAQADMRAIPAAAGGGTGGGSGGTTDDSSGDGQNQQPKKDKKKDDGGDDFFAFGKGIFGKVMEGAMVAMAGLNAASEWSEYDNTARQITITEHLTPEQSAVEEPRLKLWADNLATQYANSSKGVLDAYSFLITDSLSKQTVESILPGLAEASTAYDVPLTKVVQAAFTLSKNLGIPVEKMADGMAVLHHAAMIGHFNMEDLSTDLPGLGGQMSLMGMHGMRADIVGASALEIIRRNTGDSSEAANDLKEMLMYFHSPMALRMFDRTKRMEDMLGPSGEKLLKKYHIQPLDLPDYLNAERAKGIDPIDAMVDYFTEMTKNISSPTDKSDLVGAIMHNHQAQQAILSLMQYHQDFDDFQKKLSHVSDSTLAQDYDVATEGGTPNYKIFQEQWAEKWRWVGGLANDLLGAANGLMEFQYGQTHGYGPNNDIYGPGLDEGDSYLKEQQYDADAANGDNPTAAIGPLQITPQIPVTVNVHIDKSDNVTVDGGVTGGVMNAPIGTNVRVNQGNVLNGVH